MGAILRHQPGLVRTPLRGKPASRGASRLVAKKPWALRLPRFTMAQFKRLTWPLLLLALGVGVYELNQRLLPYANQPIAKISVQGELSYSSQPMIQQRIAPFAAASFFSVDLAGLRSELESMPWIAHAEVRRIWPDQVLIHLEEHLPIARWGDDALLNNQGQAFVPDQLATYQHLPQLYGPKRAQQHVMQQYQVLSQMLRPLGFSVARLELRARGSWFLSTGPDSRGQSIELLLGRDRLLEKMRRFIVIYDKTLKQQNANIARIDLRYAYGLAVSWREPVASTTADANPAVQ